jgi:hypothetical protein
VRSLAPCLAGIRKPLTIPDLPVRIRVRCCVHADGGDGLPRTGAGTAGAGRPRVTAGAATRASAGAPAARAVVAVIAGTPVTPVAVVFL